jgi:hypothetical protein
MLHVLDSTPLRHSSLGIGYTSYPPSLKLSRCKDERVGRSARAAVRMVMPPIAEVASPRTEEVKRTNAGEVTRSLEEGRVSPVRGFSLGNVERLCEALELTGEKMDPLSPLVEATHIEVSKLRALAEALSNEVEALELEADEARASLRDAQEARDSRGADEARAGGNQHASASPGHLLSISLELDDQEAGASSGAQEAGGAGVGTDLRGDVKVLKKQLEAVTVAYVRQGAALQAAKARLRRTGSDSPKAVAGRQSVSVSARP